MNVAATVAADVALDDCGVPTDCLEIRRGVLCAITALVTVGSTRLCVKRRHT